MKDIKLKNCPCCGSGLVGYMKTNKRSTRGYVYCMECGLRTETKYDDRNDKKRWKQKAAESWNTRKPMDRIIDKLEDGRNAYADDYFEFRLESSRGGLLAIDTAIEIVKGESDEENN